MMQGCDGSLGTARAQIGIGRGGDCVRHAPRRRCGCPPPARGGPRRAAPGCRPGRGRRRRRCPAARPAPSPRPPQSLPPAPAARRAHRISAGRLAGMSRTACMLPAWSGRRDSGARRRRLHPGTHGVAQSHTFPLQEHRFVSECLCASRTGPSSCALPSPQARRSDMIG
jgi:hypothetical protein